jgi:hypothetical protein
VGFASRALRIRAGERRITAIVVALMFVSLSVIVIAESGINALFFDRIGTDALPLMYLAQAGSTVVAMFALTAVLGRLSHRLVYVVSPLLLAVVVMAERAVLIGGARWIYPLMWVTVAFAALSQAIGLWGTAGAVVDTRQAKRLFPIFGAGGILGSVVGGLLTPPLARLVGSENLLLIWAGGLIVASALCRLALHADGATGGPASGHRRRSLLRDIRSGFGFVRRSHLLMAMAVAAVLFSVLFYSLFLPFATAATERFPDADELAGFLGLVGAVVAGTAFLLSMLVTNRLFASFGVPAMILVLPLLYAGAFGILLVASGFATLVALRIGTGVWLQGVTSPAWETLVNVVPEDRRDQTRAFLNGGPSQVGTAIAGIVALLGQDVLSARQFALVGLAASLLTIAAAVAIRASYGDALLQALLAGRPRMFEKPSAWTPVPLAVDAEATHVLVDSMGAEDVRLRRLAFELAAELPEDMRPNEVEDGLNDADPVVRLAAVRVIDTSTPSGGEMLLAMIDDPEPSIGAAASSRALGFGGGTRAWTRLRSLLGDDEPAVRRATVEQLWLAPADAAGELAGSLLDDPVAEVRAAALERVAEMVPDRALGPAVAATHDEDPAVRLAAGRALGACGPRAVEHVLSSLGDPLTSGVAVEAARRLRADGEAAHVRRFVQAATVRATRDRELAAAIPADDDAGILLRDAILERGRRVGRSALWAATMIAPRPEAMQTAIENLDGPPPQLANALETLETASEPGLVRPLLTLWEPTGGPHVDDDAWLARALADEDELIRWSAELIRARRGGVEMPRSPETIPVIERVLFLRQVPLLADLTPQDLERVARIAEECSYADGETIAPEGELGEELHVVVEGVIRVIQDASGDVRELARRTTGDVVGEMSVITRSPRIASLVADGVVRTIRIGHREFESMLRERPDVAIAVIRVLAQRIAEVARPVGPVGD